ncbi:hypothetical protein BD410DRAFT_584818 [Rickenella mellea]|uniref:Uncharacterized protein n=1 Tax=Rickenella mellea TaxID=50990 RepID=A0A4Y7PPS6_9AGAM|nr:hypothetical protein BD410DRAFT_584818 [Rickenella mellea]
MPCSDTAATPSSRRWNSTVPMNAPSDMDVCVLPTNIKPGTVSVLSALVGVCSAASAHTSILGVANGHTTYEVVGATEGVTLTETLIVGPTDVSLTVDVPAGGAGTIQVGAECGVSGNVAICTGHANQKETVLTITLPPSALSTNGGSTSGALSPYHAGVGVASMVAIAFWTAARILS